MYAVEGPGVEVYGVEGSGEEVYEVEGTKVDVNGLNGTPAFLILASGGSKAGAGIVSGKSVTATEGDADCSEKGLLDVTEDFLNFALIRRAFSLSSNLRASERLSELSLCIA